MRVLAIDPGYERLGVAVLEKQNTREVELFSSCVITDKKQGHSERLARIGKEIQKIIKEWKPQSLATETLFLFTNQKTAMKVAEARGVILYEAARAGLQVFEYTPLQIKIAVTGYGRSDKHQVAEMVKRLVELPAFAEATAGKPPKKRLDDEYDAIAIGLTCLASERVK